MFAPKMNVRFGLQLFNCVKKCSRKSVKFNSDNKLFSLSAGLRQELNLSNPYENQKYHMKYGICTKEECDAYDNDFHKIVKELLLIVNENYPEIQKVAKRFERALYYTVPSGKKIRGLTVVGAYRSIESDPEVYKKQAHLANLLGWTAEMINGYCCVLDDIVDQSDYRRGSPCWYKLPEIGLSAVFDAFLIENSIYKLFQNHLRHHESYVNILDLYHETIYNTVQGQLMDTSGVPIEKFTEERFDDIIVYKTAFYSFHLPVASALYLANIKDERVHKQTKEIMLDMGHYFQSQNDYLDCYFQEDSSGKDGTDIQTGKCSWVIVNALKRANLKQIEILHQCYGKADKESVDTVKRIYRELDMTKVYREFEKASYDNIMRKIDAGFNKGLNQFLKQLAGILLKRHC